MTNLRTKARLAVSEFQSASRAKFEAERDFTRAFVAKHEESPDMYCSGCAVVAAEWRGGVTFAPDECAHLRELVAYLSQGFVGPDARKGLEILKRKLS